MDALKNYAPINENVRHRVTQKSDTSATIALNLAMMLFGSILALLGIIFSALGVLEVLTGQLFGHGAGIKLLIAGAPPLFIGAWIARTGLNKIKQRQTREEESGAE
jgi:hypothetical protein